MALLSRNSIVLVRPYEAGRPGIPGYDPNTGVVTGNPTTGVPLEISLGELADWILANGVPPDDGGNGGIN